MAALVLAASLEARAGAWLLPEGEGQAILTLRSVDAREGFGPSGADEVVPDLSKTEAELLLEYGLRDHTTLVFRPQLTSVSIGEPVFAERQGVGYTELGVRRRLWQGERSVFSVQGMARIPGTEEAENPAAAGHTELETDLRLLGGRGFEIAGRDAFLEAQAAYRARLGDPPGEARLDLTFGVRAHERLLLLVQSFNVASDGSAQGVFSDGRYHKLKLSGVWEVAEGWSVQLGWVATVAGEEALKERGVVAALWRRF